MSVRVNLLPQATRERDRAGRQRNGLIAAGFLLILGLGAAYWWAAGEVSAAEDHLALEQARSNELRGEVGELSEFNALATRQAAADVALQEALAGEVSFAGVLQDLAAVTPSDAQLESFNLSLGDPAAEGSPEAGLSVARFSATGKTLAAHAPGVERFLLELEKVIGFRDLYLNTSALDDPDDRIATFSIEGGIGQQATTARYADGLPEELR
jgi:hypothetical protein